MHQITAEDIARTLTYPELVEALRRAFRDDITVPIRRHHIIPTSGRRATLLLMPACTGDRTFIGCKLLTVYPDNATRGEPSVYGSYLLLSGASGEPLALMDGHGVAARCGPSGRSHYGTALAREPRCSRRSCRTRNDRHRHRQSRGGSEFGRHRLVRATHEPLARGALLKSGAHIGLVGGFTPAMDEADDATVRREPLCRYARGSSRKGRRHRRPDSARHHR